MTPKEYKDMMAYLTRSGIKDKVKFASDIARPDPKPIVKEIELFNAFNRRNPMAGGGMLVQPSADGSRPGYAGDKSLKPGQKKFTSIGKEPGIFKISTRASDQIKFAINYTDNEGNYKVFKSPGGFKNITEAKKARNKKITSLEKELNIPGSFPIPIVFFSPGFKLLSPAYPCLVPPKPGFTNIPPPAIGLRSSKSL